MIVPNELIDMASDMLAASPGTAGRKLLRKQIECTIQFMYAALAMADEEEGIAKGDDYRDEKNRREP